MVAAFLFVVFASLSDAFMTWNNIFNIFRQVSIISAIAIGMTFVFLIGGMDLSAGSNVFLGAVVTGALIRSGVGAVPAMLVAVVICALTGLLNGVFIEKMKIHSVIVTLGSQLLIRGLALVIIKQHNSWIWMNRDPVLRYINVGTVGPIPVIFVIVIVLYTAAYLVLKHTEFGKKVYAVGGNTRAAELCGVQISRVKIMCFVICGITAGIAGIIAACRLGMVNPSVGLGMEFDAVTAVVLGGASFKGGEGNVLKTLVGAVIVGFIVNFMTLYGVDAHFQSAVTGGFILAAAVLNRVMLSN
jgi:ribose transport system permease protein